MFIPVLFIIDKIWKQATCLQQANGSTNPYPYCELLLGSKKSHDPKIMTQAKIKSQTLLTN